MVFDINNGFCDAWFCAGGRLPVTWYPNDFIKVPMTDMRMRPDPSQGYPGRTYRFYRGEKVFEFGYGLSYTKYAYKFLSVSQRVINFKNSHLIFYEQESAKSISISDIGSGSCEKAKFSAAVGVKNNGKMAGKHRWFFSFKFLPSLTHPLD